LRNRPGALAETIRREGKNINEEGIGGREEGGVERKRTGCAKWSKDDRGTFGEQRVNLVRVEKFPMGVEGIREEVGGNIRL